MINKILYMVDLSMWTYVYIILDLIYHDYSSCSEPIRQEYLSSPSCTYSKCRTSNLSQAAPFWPEALFQHTLLSIFSVQLHHHLLYNLFLYPLLPTSGPATTNAASAFTKHLVCTYSISLWIFKFSNIMFWSLVFLPGSSAPLFEEMAGFLFIFVLSRTTGSAPLYTVILNKYLQNKILKFNLLKQDHKRT